MSANLLPQMPAIKNWLDDASRKLTEVDIPSSVLDSEVLLAYAYGKDRTYLHAHPEQIIDSNTCELANNSLASRLSRVPVAYIIGKKEFYGRQFMVTNDTLIPRPESETIIELLVNILKPIPKNKTINLIDVGSGSGCLGITAKLEVPSLNVTLSDVSDKALDIAKQNAKTLLADVTVIKSDLLQNYTLVPDIIIANLPYVDRTWKRSPETNFEPSLALFADNNGLSIIENLIVQARNILKPDSYLIIESDPSQHKSLIEFAKKQSLIVENKKDYVIVFKQKNIV